MRTFLLSNLRLLRRRALTSRCLARASPPLLRRPRRPNRRRRSWSSRRTTPSNSRLQPIFNEPILSGQWVAQLSSKYVGVHDPLQETIRLSQVLGRRHTCRAPGLALQVRWSVRRQAAARPGLQHGCDIQRRDTLVHLSPREFRVPQRCRVLLRVCLSRPQRRGPEKSMPAAHAKAVGSGCFHSQREAKSAGRKPAITK